MNPFLLPVCEGM